MRGERKGLPLVRGFWKAGPAADAVGPVTVSLTDFRVDRFRDLPAIAIDALRIRHGWGRREGSVGLSLWVQPLRRRLGSVSAWRGEGDLSRWLGSGEHRRVVRKYGTRMHNVSSATWIADRFVLSEAWDEVARRRAAARG